MRLKYTETENVIIGTGSQDEHKYQLANHYNMVEGDIKRALVFLNDLKKEVRQHAEKHKIQSSKMFNINHLIDNIEHEIKNASAQHFNQGQTIKRINGLNIIAE